MLNKDTNMLRTYQDAIEPKLELTGRNTVKEKWNKIKKTILDAAKETLEEKIHETEAGLMRTLMRTLDRKTTP